MGALSEQVREYRGVGQCSVLAFLWPEGLEWGSKAGGSAHTGLIGGI